MLLKYYFGSNVYGPLILKRCISAKSAHETKKDHDVKLGKKMSGWQVHSYSDNIQYSDNIKIPTIKDSNELLIKVNSTSVNPIDVAMARELSFCVHFVDKSISDVTFVIRWIRCHCFECV